MGSSVDRRGIDQVIDGYTMFHEQSGRAYYSIWQGRQLKFAHSADNVDEGITLLQENLQYIETSRSKATYTIRVHKETDKDQMISDKTPYYGSFNFIVFDEYGASQQGIAPAGSANYGEISALRREIEELKRERDASIGDIQTPLAAEHQFAMEILNNPLVQQIGSILVQKFTGSNTNNENMFRRQQQRPQPQGLAGTHTAETEEEKEARVVAAINRIYALDPDLPDVLERLADLIERTPNKYKMAKSFL